MPSDCWPTATSSSRTCRASARRSWPGLSRGPSTLRLGRIQGTPDLLPFDVTGSSLYEGGAFRFVPGPVFTNVLLVDEINRATPRTQSALLEAMQERQVSIEGQTRPLP